MKTNRVVVPILACYFLTALVTAWQTLPPSPLPASAPAKEFSAERAIGHIEAIAREPRPTGSAANDLARRHILAVLQGLGLETQTQRDGDLENVLGRIPGTDTSDAVLLTAHLDSTPESPGAMDDASGVAALLETARALTTDRPFRNTVMFLFTDHEEGGLYGAKAFIAHHPWARDVRVVIGFDAGGIRGPGVLSATSPDNGWLIQQLARADPYVIGSSAINALADSSTDFGRAFRVAGFSGYAFDLYWDKRSGSEDSVENLSPSSIQHQGYHAVRLARHFGNLDSLADPRLPDDVYFSVLRLFVVRYPSTWATPIAVAVTGVFVLVLGYGLRDRILSWRGIGYGTLVMPVGALVAALPYGILEHLVGPWVPAVTSDYDHRLIDQPFQIGVVFLAALALTLVWNSQSRRIRATSVPDLAFGASVPMVAGLVVTSIAFPALSYGFAWPLLINLLAGANWLYDRVRHDTRRTTTVGLVLSGVVSIVVVGPAVMLGLFDQLLYALVSLGALCGYLVPQVYLALDDRAVKS